MGGCVGGSRLFVLGPRAGLYLKFSVHLSNNGATERSVCSVRPDLRVFVRLLSSFVLHGVGRVEGRSRASSSVYISSSKGMKMTESMCTCGRDRSRAYILYHARARYYNNAPDSCLFTGSLPSRLIPLLPHPPELRNPYGSVVRERLIASVSSLVDF